MRAQVDSLDGSGSQPHFRSKWRFRLAKVPTEMSEAFVFPDAERMPRTPSKACLEIRLLGRAYIPQNGRPHDALKAIRNWSPAAGNDQPTALPWDSGENGLRRPACSSSGST